MASPTAARREVRDFESTYPLYEGAGMVRVVLLIADRLTRRRLPHGQENGQRSACPKPKEQLENAPQPTRCRSSLAALAWKF